MAQATVLPRPRVWRPPWYVLIVLGLAALAALHERAPWLLHGHWLFVTGVGLAAVLLLAAALWELPVAGIMCAAIALTIFSGNWGSLGLPGFPFLPDRILIVFALLALALHAPGAAGLPKPRVRDVHLLLAATVLYTVASAAAAGTLGNEAAIFDLLDRLGAIPFLMLLIAPVVFAGPRERDLLLATLVGLGAYLGVTALFETIGPHGLVFPRYIAASDALRLVAQPGGPFREPISEGFACFACGTAAAIACWKWRGRRRYLAGAVLGLSALGAFLTLERGVWIAAAAAVAAAALAAPELRRRLLPGVAVCALLIGGALIVFPAIAGHASARAADQTSVWDRQNQTATAMRMIQARPLFGFGWDNYENVSLGYFRQAPNYPMTGYADSGALLPLHDTYLSNAVELGLVGVMLWIACLCWGLGGAIFSRGPDDLRPWKLGLLALAVFFCVLAGFDPLQQNFTQLLLWTWAGLCMAGLPASADRRPDVRVSRVRKPDTGQASTVAVVVR